MTVSRQRKAELNWWLTNLKNAFKNILLTPFDMVLNSDVTKTGLGATLGDQSTGGNWCQQEIELHINVLEMKAAYFALFVLKLTGKHVIQTLDNSTVVFVIDNMGTSHNEVLLIELPLKL